MNDRYDDFVAYAQQHFEEGLIRGGFIETAQGWRGAISRAKGTTDVLISLEGDFPFQPPSVTPIDPDAVPWSWHRELSGSLCLVAEDDHGGLWWTEAVPFLEHVTAWFEQSDNGWPEDRPDLDLDRYFHPSDDTRAYLYGELTSRNNGFIRFHPSGNNTMRMGSVAAPKKSTKSAKYRIGYAAEIGDLDMPPRTWADLSALIDPNTNLDRRIHRHEVTVVMLTYRRGDHIGTITLEVFPTKDGGIAARRLRSAADTQAARSARAGLSAVKLQGCRVAIVGLGALGSFVADILSRSGISYLTLVDHDIVLPGNVIRHLVGPDAVGLPKVEAVKRYIVGRRQLQAASIATIGNRLTGGKLSAELIQAHDLVVNATADFTTTALLHVTAEALEKQVVSTALQYDGATYRIDILPPLGDAAPLPSVAENVPHIDDLAFESGCGSPISPTPPGAVIEAAAATARHAIGLLIDQPLHPAGEVRHLTETDKRTPQ